MSLYNVQYSTQNGSYSVQYEISMYFIRRKFTLYNILYILALESHAAKCRYEDSAHCSVIREV